MFSKALIRSTLNTLRNATDSGHRLYTGESPTLVVDVDGEASKVRLATSNEIGLLSLEASFKLGGEIYRGTIAIDSMPDPNLKWWVSVAGATPQRCQVLKIEGRNQGAYWAVFVQRAG